MVGGLWQVWVVGVVDDDEWCCDCNTHRQAGSNKLVEAVDKASRKKNNGPLLAAAPTVPTRVRRKSRSRKPKDHRPPQCHNLSQHQQQCPHPITQSSHCHNLSNPTHHTVTTHQTQNTKPISMATANPPTHPHTPPTHPTTHTLME